MMKKLYIRRIIFLLIVCPLTGLFCHSKSPTIKLTDYLNENDFYTISIISMNEWGGEPYSGTYELHRPQYLTLHHSGTDWDESKDVQEHLRNLQNWSRKEKQWIDIPYHYMIDREGKIYEARNPQFPVDTNTAYDTRGHLLTCVIGNYENQKPTIDQIEAIINLLSWQCSQFTIKPETVKGHRDYTQTACPGKHLYRYISSGFLKREIIKRINKVILK